MTYKNDFNQFFVVGLLLKENALTLKALKSVLFCIQGSGFNEC